MAKQIDILVIDDEQVVREAVCRVCEAGGLTADAAADAHTGLERLQRNKYRIVVCDIMLPELDGFHILDAMKQAGVRTPLIMITGYSTMQNAVNSLKNGAIDFVAKPFTADELESAIRRGLLYEEFARATVTRGLRETDVSHFSVPCPAAYYRLGNLTWARTEQNGSGLIGIMDLYLKSASGVKEIKLLDAGQELVMGSTCAWITSVPDLVHSVLSPLSGRIVERNESLLSDPEVLEKDPYFAGWLYRIIPTDAANELQHLTCCIQDH